MDISSLVNQFVNKDTIQGIAQKVNVPADSVKKVVSAGIPSLIDGVKEQGSQAAAGFAEALISHGKEDTADIKSFIGNIDLNDGKKIVSHLLGDKASATVSEISRNAGVSEEKTSNILSTAAPMLMSLLGKDSESAGGASGIASLLSKVDVGSLLPGDDSAKASGIGSVLGGIGKLFKK